MNAGMSSMMHVQASSERCSEKVRACAGVCLWLAQTSRMSAGRMAVAMAAMCSGLASSILHHVVIGSPQYG